MPCYIGASALLQCYIGVYSALLHCYIGVLLQWHVTLFTVPCYNVKLVSVPCYNVLLFTVPCYNACSFMWVLLPDATPGIHRFLLLTAAFCSLQCMCSFMWAAWVSCRGGTGSAGPGRQITERHVYHHPKHVCRVHWDTIQYKAIQYFQWVVGAVSDVYHLDRTTGMFLFHPHLAKTDVAPWCNRWTRLDGMDGSLGGVKYRAPLIHHPERQNSTAENSERKKCKILNFIEWLHDGRSKVLWMNWSRWRNRIGDCKRHQHSER